MLFPIFTSQFKTLATLFLKYVKSLYKKKRFPEKILIIFYNVSFGLIWDDYEFPGGQFYESPSCRSLPNGMT